MKSHQVVRLLWLLLISIWAVFSIVSTIIVNLSYPSMMNKALLYIIFLFTGGGIMIYVSVKYTFRTFENMLKRHLDKEIEDEDTDRVR